MLQPTLKQTGRSSILTQSQPKSTIVLGQAYYPMISKDFEGPLTAVRERIKKGITGYTANNAGMTKPGETWWVSSLEDGWSFYYEKFLHRHLNIFPHFFQEGGSGNFHIFVHLFSFLCCFRFFFLLILF